LQKGRISYSNTTSLFKYDPSIDRIVINSQLSKLSGN
jgi:hypothetical protein